MSDSYNPETDGAQMSFARDMSYGDYLHIDQILSAQTPLSSAHDEMLFIIQHQTSELWIKLALHEASAARALLEKGDYAPAFKMCARLSRIFDQLNSAWDVLRTMTPSDYTTFRETLGRSSGFQSPQYRPLIDFEEAVRGPVERDENYAEQRVTVTGPDGRTATYEFGLSVQSVGEFRGCWQTDRVFLV